MRIYTLSFATMNRAGEHAMAYENDPTNLVDALAEAKALQQASQVTEVTIHAKMDSSKDLDNFLVHFWRRTDS